MAVSIGDTRVVICACAPAASEQLCLRISRNHRHNRSQSLALPVAAPDWSSTCLCRGGRKIRRRLRLRPLNLAPSLPVHAKNQSSPAADHNSHKWSTSDAATAASQSACCRRHTVLQHGFGPIGGSSPAAKNGAGVSRTGSGAGRPFPRICNPTGRCGHIGSHCIFTSSAEILPARRALATK